MLNNLLLVRGRFPRRLAWAMLAALAIATGELTPARCASNSTRQPFEFQDGDRVVLVGDTLIEREAVHGYWEYRLATQFPERAVTFRNLGWSADTPAGESRASFDFDKPGKGFEKLKAELAATRPTVVIVGYGMANSFDGPAGVEKFQTSLNRLMDAVDSMSTNRPVRFILLSPIRHEDLGEPLPDPASHNRDLAAYAKAVEQVASARKCEYVSLFDLEVSPGERAESKGRDKKGTRGKAAPLTDNGIHLTAAGYLITAGALAKGLGWGDDSWRVEISTDGGQKGTEGIKVSDVVATREGIKFEALTERVVAPVMKAGSGRPITAEHPCRLQVSGLRSGTYELKVDGSIVLTATGKEWAKGVPITGGPQFEQAAALRRAILKKNELYFNRWRPQNETYLFGFRKYEQGQNAKEIPMFDPLIEEQEARIKELKQPRKHSFEITRVNDGGNGFRSAIELARDKSREEALSPAHLARGGEQTKPEFEVAPGLQVNLYAESPLLAKPIQMNFDPQGRLWIASSSVYPQIQPGQVADDKIIVLEDRDGDGYAETSKAFADGLFIPTSVVPGDGGAYVGQGTEMLHFKDTNGDGKADQKRVVLSAFGTEDTHHMVHTLRWGPDGQLYFNQSIYIHTYIETPHGVERLNSGGVWHLRPPTMELGVYLRGFCNPWGHEFDEFGQSFLTDGAGGKGINYGLPGATYFTYANMRREMDSISPGSYPKFCSLEVLRSAHFPKAWQGNVITCDFRAHRVVRFTLEEKGAGYAATEAADVLRSTNVSFRPIDAKLGPDGALYIADWSNPIIQHGEVDFRDARRDHEHGRIWRITAKGQPLVARPKLHGASNEKLLDELLSVNAFNQQQARRVLTERGKEIEKDLAKWTRKQSSEMGKLQALWMYQSIDVVQPQLLEEVLRAKDGRIRSAGVRVAGYWHARLRHPIKLLAACVKDQHPRVRLEAVRSLALIPSARTAELVLSALDQPMDSFLDYGIWLSINDLAQPWLAAVKSGTWKTEGHENQLEFALKAIEPIVATEILGQVLQSRKIARDGSGPWIQLIGTAGDAPLLRRLYEQVLGNEFDEETTVRVLEALEMAARDRDVKPSGNLEGLRSLVASSNPKIKAQTLRLVGRWKLAEFIPELIGVAEDRTSAEALRSAALDSLRDTGGDQVKTALKPLTTSQQDRWGREHAILTLAALDVDAASSAAAGVLADMTSEKEAEAFWQSLLTIKGAAPAIARALPKTGLPAVVAKAGLRAARSGGRNEPDLVWALTRGANLEEESQTLSARELQELAKTVMKQGDAARGEMIFRRKDLACVSCHAVGGVGGKVGPDMTSIGASAQTDYLIESVLYPNRKIKEGFHTAIVETTEGNEFSGVVANENAEQLLLRDATGKEIQVLKKDIKNRTAGGSLMPGGLVDSITSAERLDLYRFLSELGKPGPFDASKSSVARAWKLFPQTLALAQFGDEKILATDLTNKAWLPAIALVDGRLLKEELNRVLDEVKQRDPRAVYAAARFEASKAGPVSFRFEGGEAAQVWMDGKPMAGGHAFTPDVQVGRHTAIIKLDSRNLPDAIRLESADVTFLAN